MKTENFAGLSKQERKFISHFSALEQDVINAEDLMKLHNCTKKTANAILSRLAKKGWIQRIKRGVYILIPLSTTTAEPVIENAWTLAMNLFRPAYISGWSAAEHWNLTEQIFNSVSVATETPQRNSIQIRSGIKFRVKLIKKNNFFGISKVWFGSRKVNVANPSRMLIDILDMPSFGGGGRHVVDIVRQYWISDMCKPELLFQYALRYNKGVVFKRLGFLAENLNAPVSKEWIESCRQHVTSGISSLDPDSPKNGEIISRWNLRINLPL